MKNDSTALAQGISGMEWNGADKDKYKDDNKWSGRKFKWS